MLWLLGVVAILVGVAGAAMGVGASGEPVAEPSVEPSASPTELPTPAIMLTVAPAWVQSGRVATFTAKIGVPGASLSVSRRRAGDIDFTSVSTVKANSSGRASWSVRLRASATYRVEYAGDTSWAPAVAEATIHVRPNITLKVRARRPTFRHNPVRVNVHVGLPHPGATVMLKSWNAKKKAWVDARSLTLNADSRATTVLHPEIGILKIRVRMAADLRHAAGRSNLVRLRVFDPRNPYGIPTKPAHFIVVDLSQFRLYYHEHGIVVRVFPCVLGRPSLPTPRGHFKIYAKDAHMSGPYGPRRMRYRGLYAIHGTNEPWLLKRFPRRYSHGCTRLSNANILWLFKRCPVGTPVWNVP
jgi:hypothetical protein